MAESEPIELTNQTFLRTLFPGCAAHAWVTAFPDDPDVTRDQKAQGRLWGGAPAARRCGGKIYWKETDWNTFYVISTFNENAEGKVRRRKALFRDCRVIMIDDVGEVGKRGVKVSEDDLRLIWGVEPSYVIETSPGNCQWGLILREPETRQWAVEQLQDGMIAKGLTADQKDPGMANVTRYCRLPEGVNTKAKHVKANGGKPWRHVVHHWEPTCRYTVEELADLFNIKLVKPGTSQTGTVIDAGDRPDDPILEAMHDAGLVKGALDAKGDKYEVTCFNIESHTGGRDDGAAYFRRGSVDEQGKVYPMGGFHCFHGGCTEKNVGHLIRWLQDEGWLPRETRSADEVFADLEYEAPPAPAGETDSPAGGRLRSGEVRDLLDKNEDGKILKSAENIRTIVSRDAGIPPVEFNTFYGHKTLGRNKWADVFDINIMFYIAQTYGPEMPKAKVQDVTDHVAHANVYDPVREYLESLEWDGEKRLDTWLLDYAGVEEDNVYTREAGRKILLAAVMRTFEPGAKFDHMLILEGPQGAGKSSLLRELCPKQDWFLDSHLSIGRAHKEAAEQLRGKWIVEVPELASFRKAETEPLKAFLSQQRDDYRPAYGRETVSYPRRCVFFGTTNESEYLQDATGARRFWPVRTVGKLHWELMRKNRDQLWAEAVVAYRSGEQINLGDRAYAVAAAEADARYEDDDWAPLIDLYLAENEGMTFTTAAALAYGALSIPSNRIDRATQTRLSLIMKRRGWKKGTNRDPLDRTRVVRGYHAPKKTEVADLLS